MGKTKKRIGKRMITAVLACMLGTLFFSINAQAAIPEVTYDPDAKKAGYHLIIDVQRVCHHTADRDTRNLYTTMTGLAPTAEQVIGGIVNNRGLIYTVDSYTTKPVGIGAERVGNAVVAVHVSNVGNMPDNRVDLILSEPYVEESQLAGYSYYWHGFSHCTYTGKDYYVGGGHTWLGNTVGAVGTNEVVGTSYSHVITRYRFAPNNYNVVYNGNGATEGTMGNQSVSYDQTFNLVSNTYKRDGYRFNGWNTAPNGNGQSFSNRQSVSNLTSQDGGTVTLYAQWTPITYMVHFDGNGATSGNTTDQRCIFGRGGALNVNGFKKQYDIRYDGNGGTSEKENATAAAAFNGWQDNNTTYYKGMYFNYHSFDAPYYINKYQDVKNWCGYNKYEALGHWYTYIIAQGKENRQSARNFKIDDYMQYGGSDLAATFGNNRPAYVSHWQNHGIYEGRKGAAYIDSGTSDLYPNQAWVANLATREGENITLTADWTPGSVILPTAERSGYRFAGWYTKPKGGNLIGNAGETYIPDAGGRTLYAQWKANTYIIRFDGNGATEGSMEDIPAVYDQDITLPPNLFIRITDQGESVFNGWNQDNTVYETQYADQETVRNFTPEDGAIVTLYAIWDDCPEIEAVDRYFSLDFARQGKITEEELLSTAAATDCEDGGLENRTSEQIAESGLNRSLSLYGYAATDFTEFTDSGSVSMTYKAVDSAGNTVYKTVTVFISNTEPLPQTEFQYTRVINEKYYKAAYEAGGLHPKSIWRSNVEYQNVFEGAVRNLKNDTPEDKYSIVSRK